MAIPVIRTTYALDQATVEALEDMARRWGVSKSEALRRAIRAAATAQGPGPGLTALEELQREAGLTPARAAVWVRRARSERHASAARRESRSG